MKGVYFKDSKLDFGMYKGYELGIVYVFDPTYVDWCINNINRFYVGDLQGLSEYSVLNEKLDWQYKMIGDPSLIPNIDIFDTFQELIENVALGDKKYCFSEKTIQKNDDKCDNNQIASGYINDQEDSVASDSFSDWNDQSTWGNDQGRCDMADSCYECPYANECF